MARLLVDLSPLRESRDFRLLYGGQLVSVVGSQFTIVAIPIQTYAMTKSTFWVGAVSLIQLVPLILGSLWGGAVADRVDKRPLMSLAALAQALIAAALAINAALKGPLYVLVVLATLWAAAGGFANPARSAAIPILVGKDRLVAAYSLNQVMFQIGSVVGPALGGAIIAFVGLKSCYTIDAASFLVLSVATAMMHPIPPLEGVAHDSVIASTKAGFAYVRSHIAAQCVYLIDLNAMIFGMPTAVFPQIAHEWFHGGAGIAGLLYAAPGAGALVGAVASGWVERVRRRGRMVVLAVALWGAAIAAFGFSRTLWLTLVLLAVAGWADVISAVLRNTILQSTITDEFRGRLSAIQMAVVTGGPRLGNFEAGTVAALTSAEFSIISGGLACIFGAFALVKWRPSFWTDEADL